MMCTFSFHASVYAPTCLLHTTYIIIIDGDSRVVLSGNKLNVQTTNCPETQVEVYTQSAAQSRTDKYEKNIRFYDNLITHRRSLWGIPIPRLQDDGLGRQSGSEVDGE